MELAKIESLLEQYFEGNTTLEQEAQLAQYFATADLPDHLAPYKDLFAGFGYMRQQKSEKTFVVPQEKRRNPIWGYAAAAVIGVLLSVGIFMNNSADDSPTLTAEQQEAVEAFEQAKKALEMISGNLNDCIEGMAYLNEFDKAAEQIFK